MAKPLRQTIELPVGDRSVGIDVTFRILEIVERHYDMRAEYVGKLILENEVRIKRTDVARVITDWVSASGVERDAERAEVYESVLAAPIDQLRVYVGAIQGAIYYALREISAEELATLARGEDLSAQTDDDGETDGEDGDDKKKASSG